MYPYSLRKFSFVIRTGDHEDIRRVMKQMSFLLYVDSLKFYAYEKQQKMGLTENAGLPKAPGCIDAICLPEDPILNNPLVIKDPCRDAMCLPKDPDTSAAPKIDDICIHAECLPPDLANPKPIRPPGDVKLKDGFAVVVAVVAVAAAAVHNVAAVTASVAAAVAVVAWKALWVGQEVENNLALDQVIGEIAK